MRSPKTTVREIAVAQPAAAPVFEKIGIDYCCAAYRTMAAQSTTRLCSNAYLLMGLKNTRPS